MSFLYYCTGLQELVLVYTALGECKVCIEHLHLLLPLHAAKTGLLTVPLHTYWGGNNVVPALQNTQNHCFALAVSIILLVGYSPKSWGVLHVTVQSWCESPGLFSSTLYFHFCASAQKNGSNNHMKKVSLYFLLQGSSGWWDFQTSKVWIVNRDHCCKWGRLCCKVSKWFSIV